MSENSLDQVHRSVKIPSGKNPWKKLFAFVGPAYLVSVGYMDPGNWATDIAGGSVFGYQLIWVLLLSNLMALLLQSLSARLGIVRGLRVPVILQSLIFHYIFWPKLPLRLAILPKLLAWPLACNYYLVCL